jgi:hypothetical protein
MNYAYAYLGGNDLFISRIMGPGLGNMLFPWARSAVFSQINHIALINPTWPNISIGPYIRHEIDKRSYRSLFKANKENISGFKKIVLLSTLKRIMLYEDVSFKPDLNRKRIYCFQGSTRLFTGIEKYNNQIKEEILKIANVPVGLFVESQPFIGVHVRCGDFKKIENKTDLLKGKNNTRIPILWYVDVINKLRSSLCSEAQVIIFSDGSDDEIGMLLALRNVRRSKDKSALADLMLMARSTILIAAGSTFSMWASYLGRMPVVWHRGQLRQRIYYEKPHAEIEYVEGDTIPDEFGLEVAMLFQ